MTGDLPESKVVQIWQDCAGRNDLETEEDGAVRVLYRGRLNDGSGADFLDAVIQTSHGQLTGDIEIHTKTSDWRAHRHHLDPLYNRVILHVVLRHDTAKSVRLQNGQNAPTLTLQKLSALPDDRSPISPSLISCPGDGKTRDIQLLGQVLDEAGEQRFQSRTVGYQAVSSPEEAGQALYRGVMTALGYSQNKYAMAELACRMPLRRLESMVTAATPDKECLAIYQAMLLGAAGLLPRQCFKRRRDDTEGVWGEKLARIWSAAGETVTMSATGWQFFRVRPGNYPTRRIAAMSFLLLRYRAGGLLTGLINRLDAAVDCRHRELEETLTVEARDSGMMVDRGRGSLLGRSRAADIIINVLLPFTAAWGRGNSRPEMALKAAELYRRYPVPAANTIARHMCRQLGTGEKVVNSARRQQGLLHLFKAYCSLGLCRDCPVNRAV
jgi:hypothetical protein